MAAEARAAEAEAEAEAAPGREGEAVAVRGSEVAGPEAELGGSAVHGAACALACNNLRITMRERETHCTKAVNEFVCWLAVIMKPVKEFACWQLSSWLEESAFVAARARSTEHRHVRSSRQPNDPEPHSIGESGKPPLQHAPCAPQKPWHSPCFCPQPIQQSRPTLRR